MDRTPDNERSNPISRAFSKFFERGKVGDKTPQATTRAGTPTHAATRQVTPQPRAAAPRPTTAASAAARPAQAPSASATPGLQTAASTSTARPATPAATTGAVAASTTAATRRTHTVVRGDTLSGIAKQVYGRADRWNLIFEANRDQIDDPDLIRPGQVLVIPDAPSMH